MSKNRLRIQCYDTGGKLLSDLITDDPGADAPAILQSVGNAWRLILEEQESQEGTKEEATNFCGEEAMRVVADLDWSTIYCPCGASHCNRFSTHEKWEAFKREHAPHTDGTVIDSAGSGWEKVYTKKPEDRRRPLFPPEKPRA